MVRGVQIPGCGNLRKCPPRSVVALWFLVRLVSGMCSGSLALRRVPLFRGKCDAPEKRRGFAELQPNLGFPRVLLAHKRDRTRKLFGRLWVDDGNVLCPRDSRFHPHHTPIRVYRHGVRKLLKRMVAAFSANDHRHMDLNAVRPPAVCGAIAGRAGHRRLDVCHHALQSFSAIHDRPRRHAEPRPTRQALPFPNSDFDRGTPIRNERFADIRLPTKQKLLENPVYHSLARIKRVT